MLKEAPTGGAVGRREKRDEDGGVTGRGWWLYGAFTGLGSELRLGTRLGLGLRAMADVSGKWDCVCHAFSPMDLGWCYPLHTASGREHSQDGTVPVWL